MVSQNACAIPQAGGGEGYCDFDIDCTGALGAAPVSCSKRPIFTAFCNMANAYRDYCMHSIS
jgi:hypothetical protein